MLLRTRIYKCPGCQCEMKRKSRFKTVVSYCDLKSKTVRLRLLSKVKKWKS
jgi:hypothetical protein